MGLNIGLLWTIFCYLKMLTIFEKIATLKHRNQNRNIEINIETLKSTLKHWKHWIKFNFEILKNIDIQLSFNVHFFDIENIESKSMSMSVQLQTLSTQIPKAQNTLMTWLSILQF